MISHVSFRKFLLILNALIWGAASLQAQDVEEFLEFEDTLQTLSMTVFQHDSEEEKRLANEIFLELFRDALSLNNSYKYPFDSLKLISKVVAPDDKFRIFSWMIHKEDGSYEYYGFIQSYSRRKNDYEVYPLNDVSDQLENPETKVLDYKNWYGAVYYDIILTRDGNARFYTLLGWDGNNALVRRKVIEVLTLRSNGMPRFGHSLFRYKGKPGIKRVFFEYSSLASMNLRFEKQHYVIKKKRWFFNEQRYKKRKKQKREPVRGPYREIRKGAMMIVFDQLIPMNPSLTGQYQFYVPEGNIVNGFIFKQGRWHYIEDIDARNPQQQYDNPKNRPIPEKGLSPGKKNKPDKR